MISERAEGIHLIQYKRLSLVTKDNETLKSIMKVNMVPVYIIIKYGCVFVACSFKFLPIPGRIFDSFISLTEINAVL